MMELDAINRMLEAIGEAPISTLATSGLSDGAIARRVLDSTSTQVQSERWEFNTEYNYPLTNTLTNEIPLPLNTLFVKSDDQYFNDEVISRGTRLYNKTQHTFTFLLPVTVTITFKLPFDELPQAAQEYITVKAARVFQEKVLGSTTLDQYLRSDEKEARIFMVQADAEVAACNMLSNSYTVVNLLRR